MEFKITEDKDRLILALSGDFDTIAGREAKKKLVPLFEQDDHDIMIDCTNLDYISSSGLRVFMNIYKHQHDIGRRCSMAHIKDNVRDVLDMGGFFMLFEQED